MRIIWASCERCEFEDCERVARRWWMRLLPSLRHYYCRRCAHALLAPKDVVEARQWMLSTFRRFEPPRERPRHEHPG